MIQLRRGGSISSEGFESGKQGFIIRSDGTFEFDGGSFRGHVEAESGYFNGRIEAEEGFFRGLLETPALRSSTEQVLSSQRSYPANTPIENIMISEAQFWYGAFTSPFERNYDVVGSFRGREIRRIDMRLTRGPFMRWAVLTIHFTSGSPAIEELVDNTGLPAGGLSFRRVRHGWNVQARNLPTEDPRFANVLWRNGNQLMISTG